MKVLSLILLPLLLFHSLLSAEEKTMTTPLVSGRIIDRIDLSSLPHPSIYLIIQDIEEKVWMCKIEKAELIAKVKEYKKEDYIDVYGTFIDKEARQIEVEQIEKRLNNELNEK